MKFALITGASSGIGSEIAKKIAIDHQYHILVNYCKNEDSAKTVVNDIIKKGGSASLLKFDVSNKVEVENALNDWNLKYPENYIEVLVNNAGDTKDDLLVMMTEEKWNKVLDVKLDGFFYVTSNILKSMLLKRYGRIVNISSLSGVHGGKGQVNYSAANAGLIGATKALAKEVAIRNITVNAVAPGYIKTTLTENLDLSEIAKSIPAGRLGNAEEVADLVSFLVSQKAAYINGEVIGISGGI